MILVEWMCLLGRLGHYSVDIKSEVRTRDKEGINVK